VRHQILPNIETQNWKAKRHIIIIIYIGSNADHPMSARAASAGGSNAVRRTFQTVFFMPGAGGCEGPLSSISIAAQTFGSGGAI
jgi:hypothetical protein